MSVTFSGILKASFNSLSSPGSISIPGLKVGDKVIGCWMPADNTAWHQPGDTPGTFEAIVSVDDELQQLNSSSSSIVWELLLVR
jgi:hypothetical protein